MYQPRHLVVEIKTLSRVKTGTKNKSLAVEVELLGRQFTVQPTEGGVVTEAFFFDGSEACAFPFTSSGVISFSLTKGDRVIAKARFDLSSLQNILDRIVNRSVSLDWRDQAAHATDARPILSFRIRVDPPIPNDFQASVWGGFAADDEIGPSLETSQPDRLLIPQAVRNANQCASLWAGMVAAPTPTSARNRGDPLADERPSKTAAPSSNSGSYSSEDNHPPMPAYPPGPPAYAPGPPFVPAAFGYPHPGFPPQAFAAYGPPPQGPYAPYPYAYPPPHFYAAPVAATHMQPLPKRGASSAYASDIIGMSSGQHGEKSFEGGGSNDPRVPYHSARRRD